MRNLGSRLQGKLPQTFTKSAQLSAASPRFCNHNTKPSTFCCSKWATPARHNEFWQREEMIWGIALFVVTDVLIKPILSTLQRPCVEMEAIHHDKTLKVIVYYLFILKHSFQCSSSYFCLFLVWLGFLSALSETCPLAFLRKSCRVELLQNPCNCELEIFNKILNWKHDKKLMPL